MKLIFYLTLFLFILTNTEAQTTAIPDENFEQALIDMNIDSDGVVNGQVLTADISNVVELDFTGLYPSTITDFTGIEDFTALEILNLKSVDVSLSEDQADVFNSNLNLKEFRADDLSSDTFPFIVLPRLNFTNLVNLEVISLYNNGGDTVLNLSNPNANFENLTIDLSHDYYEIGKNREVCIEVSDPQSANANNYPYNTWDIITPPPDQNGYTYVIYNFSSNCNLGTSRFNALKHVKIFPNPVQDKLNIENPQEINLDEVGIFDMTGKKVKSFSSFDEAINIERLEQGVYFVRLIKGNTSKTFRVIKK
jgi:hypothetical protein